MFSPLPSLHVFFFFFSGEEKINEVWSLASTQHLLVALSFLLILSLIFLTILKGKLAVFGI